MVATPQTFFKGEPVRITGQIVNVLSNNALTDPTVLVFEIRAPGQDKVTYTYGVSPQLTRQSTGVYNLDIEPSESGLWRWRMEASGSIKAVREGTFTVSASLV